MPASREIDPPNGSCSKVFRLWQKHLSEVYGVGPGSGRGAQRRILKVFNNLGKYNHEQSFKAWLRTILVHTAISYYRRMRKYNEFRVSIDHFSDYGIEDHNDMVSPISADEILKAVQQLKPIQKRDIASNVITVPFNRR